ncbi:MAG: hypothetical protein N2053_10895, partial [Chitinispirillaceae bacterium]|nr:hypothetical protein [Chitinispirillaceae bacterium]
PVDKGTKTERIVYTAINVTDNEAGNLIAIPSDPAYSNIKASVFVNIKGPLTELVKARTRDANGNGYLDQIELTFSKAVEFPADYDTRNIVIRYGDNIFIVDSIIGAGRGPDSVWVVVLKEIQNNKPQTNWTPFVSIAKDEKLQLDSTVNLVAEDGAGPVIWAVYKTITTTDDRRKDIIRVVFSEDVQRATGEGQSLTTADKVDMILYVWEAIPDPSDPTKITYKLIDSMLVGIENMQAVREGEIEFLTLNGVDIAPRHYVSIKVIITNEGDTTAYITDRAKDPNLPEYNNQKVRVFIKGPAPEKVHIAPNPSRPTGAHTKPGELEVKHNPEAKYWVSREKAGVLMRFTIKLPESDTIKISCMVKVYDMVGNPVISASHPNILKTLPPEALRGSVSVYDIDLYWNGCNKLGMPVAPGLYKVFVYLDSNHPEYKKKKPLAGMVGISK